MGVTWVLCSSRFWVRAMFSASFLRVASDFFVIRVGTEAERVMVPARVAPLPRLPGELGPEPAGAPAGPAEVLPNSPAGPSPMSNGSDGGSVLLRMSTAHTVCLHKHHEQSEGQAATRGGHKARPLFPPPKKTTTTKQATQAQE